MLLQMLLATDWIYLSENVQDLFIPFLHTSPFNFLLLPQLLQHLKSKFCSLKINRYLTSIRSFQKKILLFFTNFSLLLRLSPTSFPSTFSTSRLKNYEFLLLFLTSCRRVSIQSSSFILFKHQSNLLLYLSFQNFPPSFYFKIFLAKKIRFTNTRSFSNPTI